MQFRKYEDINFSVMRFNKTALKNIKLEKSMPKINNEGVAKRFCQKKAQRKEQTTGIPNAENKEKGNLEMEKKQVVFKENKIGFSRGLELCIA